MGQRTKPLKVHDALCVTTQNAQIVGSCDWGKFAVKELSCYESVINDQGILFALTFLLNLVKAHSPPYPPGLTFYHLGSQSHKGYCSHNKEY